VEVWEALISNKMLVAAVLSWLTAQVLKTLIYAIVNRSIDIHRLTGDGGMPSGHSATVTALAVSAGLYYGVSSPIFAVSSILAIVVMHDAMGVRREAGKHAEALNEIFAVLEQGEIDPERMLKEFLGHSPTQVLCGALLGLLIAVGLYL